MKGKIELNEIKKLLGIMLVAWAAILMADPVKDFAGNTLGFLPGGMLTVGLVLLGIAAYLYEI